MQRVVGTGPGRAGAQLSLTTVTVPGSLAGERVDRAVALLTSCSRAAAARLVSAGGVRVDGRLATSGSTRLVAGQSLELDAPPPEPKEAPPHPAAAGELRLVHVDEELIVVDKPAGLVVHPGAGHHEDTLVSQLLERFPELAATAGIGEPTRPGIVHRLDKDTSGLLAVARTSLAYDSLTAQLSSRAMGRRYRALVAGRLEAAAGLVEAPIGRSRRDPTRMAVTAAGREARTLYEVRARYADPLEASELAVRLETGRTHQIRVHLAAIGHPVLGDRRYGGARKLSGVERPFLHAERLELLHPRSGESCTFESPLADDLQAALGRFH